MLNGENIDLIQKAYINKFCHQNVPNNKLLICFILFCSIFILLSWESDGGAMCWTNLHLLRCCPFPSFSVVSLTSYHWICCLFKATKQR